MPSIQQITTLTQDVQEVVEHLPHKLAELIVAQAYFEIVCKNAIREGVGAREVILNRVLKALNEFLLENSNILRQIKVN